MKNSTKIVLALTIATVGAYVAKSLSDSYRELLDAKELSVDYQARNAEALGRRFPARVANNRGRRATEQGLSAPSYLC